MKWFFRLLFVTIILLVLLVGVLFLPPVQKSLLLKALSPTYGTVTVESVSAGFSGANITDLSIENEDFSIKLPSATLSFSVFDLLSGKEIYLDTLEVKQASLDFSKVSDWTALSEKYFGKTEEEKTPFSGVFSATEQLGSFGLNEVLIDMEVILPEAQRLTVYAVNQSKDPWNPHLAATITVKELITNSPIAAFDGKLLLKTNSEKQLHALELTGTLQAANNELLIEGQSTWDQLAETYRLAVTLPNARTPLIASETTYTYGTDSLTGNYFIDLQSNQLPPIGALQTLPQFMIEGKGSYQFKPSQNTFSIDSDLQGQLQELQKISPDLAQLNNSTIEARVLAQGTPTQINLNELNASLRTPQGTALINLDIAKDFIFRSSPAGWAPEKTGKWGSLRIQQLPVALFKRLLSDQEITVGSGSMDGQFDISSEENRIQISTTQPLILTAQKLSYQNKPLAEQFDLSIRSKITSDQTGNNQVLESLQILTAIDQSNVSLRTSQALPADKGLLLPDGKIAQLRIQNLDLSTANPFLPETKIRGKIIEQELALEKKGNNWRLTSPQATNIQIESLRHAGQDLLSQVNLRTQAQMLYTGKQIAFQTGDTSITSRTGEILQLAANGDVSLFSLLAGKPSGMADIRLKGNLTHAARQPFFPAEAKVRGGKINSDVTVNWGKEKTISAELNGEQITIVSPQRKTIQQIFLNLDAQQTGEKSWSIQSPFILKTNQGETNLSLLADLALAKRPLQFNATVSGESVIIDDLLFLAAGATGSEPTAPAEPSEEAEALPWESAVGSLNVNINRLNYIEKNLSIRNFTHQLTITPSGISEQTSLDNLYRGQVQTQSTLQADQHNQLTLTSNFRLAGVDARTLFSSLQGDSTQVFSGTLSGTGAVQSQAKTLSALADELVWDANIEATKGNLQILSTLTERLPFGRSSQARQLQQGVGVISGILGNTGIAEAAGIDSQKLRDVQTALTAAKLLGSLPYEQLSLRLRKPVASSPMLIEAQSNGDLFEMDLRGSIQQNDGTALTQQPLSLLMNMGAGGELKTILERLKLLKNNDATNTRYTSLEDPIQFEGTLNKLIYQDFIGKLVSATTGLNLNKRSQESATETKEAPSQTEQIIRGAEGILNLFNR